jgi:hypothetical protein
MAFVINKEIVTPQNPKLTELVPGRAASLTVRWHNSQEITILNIYAPNNLNTHPGFWNKWMSGALLKAHLPSLLLEVASLQGLALIQQLEQEV